REEEMAFRRDQPPLAVALLGGEKAGRGKLRARGPAAVLIPVRQGRMRLEFRRLRRAALCKLRFVLELAGPVCLRVLPVSVYNAVQRDGIGDQADVVHQKRSGSGRTV